MTFNNWKIVGNSINPNSYRFYCDGVEIKGVTGFAFAHDIDGVPELSLRFYPQSLDMDCILDANDELKEKLEKQGFDMLGIK